MKMKSKIDTKIRVQRFVPGMWVVSRRTTGKNGFFCKLKLDPEAFPGKVFRTWSEAIQYAMEEAVA